ncbi:hypothetical protein Tco_1393327 [Tanacetum coccineum]
MGVEPLSSGSSSCSVTNTIYSLLTLALKVICHLIYPFRWQILRIKSTTTPLTDPNKLQAANAREPERSDSDLNKDVDPTAASEGGDGTVFKCSFSPVALAPAPKRCDIVRQIGNALKSMLDYLGRVLTLEMGKFLPEGIRKFKYVFTFSIISQVT